MDLKEMWWEGVDCIRVAQNRDQWWALVNTIMDFRDAWNARNCLTSCTTISFSRRNVLNGISLPEYTTNIIMFGVL